MSLAALPLFRERLFNERRGLEHRDDCRPGGAAARELPRPAHRARGGEEGAHADDREGFREGGPARQDGVDAVTDDQAPQEVAASLAKRLGR